jgi:hypothetical protein
MADFRSRNAKTNRAAQERFIKQLQTNKEFKYKPTPPLGTILLRKGK